MLKAHQLHGSTCCVVSALSIVNRAGSSFCFHVYVGGGISVQEVASAL